MKKIILFCSFMISVFSASSQFNEDAPWMQSTNQKDKNNQDKSEKLSLTELSEMFNTYWEGKDYTKKGSGYKPFKRWEDFWRHFADEQGFLPNSNDLWKAWKTHNEFKVLNNIDESSWQSIGPHSLINHKTSIANLGRVNVIVPDPNNASIIFVGTPAGGIWKSNDSGVTWNPLSDNLPQIGVSGIAIDPANSNVIYIATGDDDAGNTISAGVFKSVDGGQTWNETGLNPSNTPNSMNDIYMHPNDANILWVATNNGLYKTINGGENWSRVHSGNIKDIKLNPNNPNILYIVTNSNFYKSSDGGNSFVQKSLGLPTSSGRLVIDVTPANSNYVYVLSSNEDHTYQGIYKSTDTGESFLKTNNIVDILESDQAWYDLSLAVSDSNPEEVYVGCLNIWKSLTGGNTFNSINSWFQHTSSFTHADIHFLRFFNNELFAGTDGGFYRSVDHGTTFQDLTQGMQIGQFYKVSVSNRNANKIAGGLQDNGGFGLTKEGDWSNYHGGDGMDNAVDPANENKYYGFTQNGGTLHISNDAGKSLLESFQGPEDGNWITPLEINNEGQLYTGYKSLYLFTGSAFTKVSPEFDELIDQMAIDESDSNNIYVAVKNKFYQSTDKGVNFENKFTFSSNITAIEVHSSNGDVIYVTTSGFGARGVFRSEDKGLNFTNITFNLPVDQAYFDIVHQDRHSKNPLFVGTSLGVYRFDDTADEWKSFYNNLPVVPIRDLEISLDDAKITAATYGRGVWQSVIHVELPDNEIRLLEIVSPTASTISQGNASLKLKVENNGQNPIEMVEISYVIDNENEVVYNWDGVIGKNSSGIIEVPNLTFDFGVHTLNVSVNVDGDAYPENNSLSGEFISNEKTDGNVLNSFEEDSDALLTYNEGDVLLTEWKRGKPLGTLLNAAASGDKVYATNLKGNHNDLKKSYLVSNYIDLSKLIFPKFTFKMAFDLEENWDIIYVEYSLDEGKTWEVMGTSNDPNWYNSNRTNETSGNADDCQNCPGAQWTGTVETITEYSYSLAPLASKKNVMFRFVFHSDPFENQEGVLIDDFILSEEGTNDDDDDNDGILDINDNCPTIPNTDQADTDNDGIGDVCDEDIDNDGIDDDVDNCTTIANEDQQDTDSDGEGDACDDDDDGDGVIDVNDNCPLTPNSDQTDVDMNGIGDDCEANDSDGDGIIDSLDNCPTIANEDQQDTDSDGEGDACDDDDDGDGNLDVGDNCPLTANANQSDVDNDGVGDSCDDDDDGDGILDVDDNCPLTANADQADIDNDGVGDSCDGDSDGDGIADIVDNCLTIPNAAQLDTDNDGEGDACDDDDDGDGILDVDDNCLLTANANQFDVDNDGLGDFCDDDDDGDGILDADDNCPLTANANQSDVDNDGLGDFCDDDDDGDGIFDVDDNCPLTANSNQSDVDNDGEGDACDDDDDGDGILDIDDNCPTIPNATQLDTDNDGIGDACDDDSDNDGIMNTIDQCPNTPINEIADVNGCSESQLDDDNDGINNAIDLCPNSTVGGAVNPNGCFSLSSDNFEIEVISETCPDKNNGQLLITANETHNYETTINGTAYSFTTSLSVGNLVPNTYDICITVSGETYEQCYTLAIAEGSTVSGKASVTSKKATVEITQGTAPYYVYLNGNAVLQTLSPSFSVDVQHGDLLEVKTTVACEGIFSKTIELFDAVIAYPNPTRGNFEISIPTSEKEIVVELYTIDSQLISVKTYPVVFGKVQINLDNKSTGLYVAKVLMEKIIIIKIIKQ